MKSKPASITTLNDYGKQTKNQWRVSKIDDNHTISWAPEQWAILHWQVQNNSEKLHMWQVPLFCTSMPPYFHTKTYKGFFRVWFAAGRSQTATLIGSNHEKSDEVWCGSENAMVTLDRIPLWYATAAQQYKTLMSVPSPMASALSELPPNRFNEC